MSAERTINGVTVDIVEGDITDQPEFDAVVNAANAELMSGGGVAGAIHRAAGAGLAKECQPLAPISPGTCVITGAHHLDNRHVVHCLGPVYGTDEPAAELLASCYRQALETAERYELTSVAFPALSTGAFGYPIQEATEIALDTVLRFTQTARSVHRIRFVLVGGDALSTHRATLERLAD